MDIISAIYKLANRSYTRTKFEGKILKLGKTIKTCPTLFTFSIELDI